MSFAVSGIFNGVMFLFAVFKQGPWVAALRVQLTHTMKPSILRGALCIYHKPQHLQHIFTYQKTRQAVCREKNKVTDIVHPPHTENVAAGSVQL